MLINKTYVIQKIHPPISYICKYINRGNPKMVH